MIVLISPLPRSSCQRADAGTRVGAKRSGGPTSAPPAWSRAQSSKESSSRSSLRSARENTLRSPPENRARPSRTAAQRPTSSTPRSVERVEVEGRALGRADQLRRRKPAGAGQVVDLVVPLVPDAGPVHPPEHVAAAVGARHPDVLAHRQGHRATRPRQLGGQLDAGRRGSDHEHAAGGELGRAAVVERRQLGDRRRHRLTERRHRRLVEGAAREDHGPAADLAVAGRSRGSRRRRGAPTSRRYRCGPGPG